MLRSLPRLPALSLSALTLGALLGLAACGSDDSADDSSSSGGAASASSTSGTPASTAASGPGAGGSGADGGQGGEGAQGGGGGQGGAAGDNDWTCLDNVVWPAPMNATVQFSATLYDVLTNDPLAGITVDACAKTDPDCLVTLATGVTDAAGQIVMTLPAGTGGFDGFFGLTSPDLPPSLVFVLPPIASDMDSIQVPLLPETTFELFAQFAGVTLDPARGHLAVAALDCALAGAAGLEIAASTADAQSTQVYIEAMLPSQTATETDASGTAGIFNVIAGPTTVTATLSATDETTATVDVLTRPGAVTYTLAPPTP